MAKRGILDHLKVIELAEALQIMEPFAVGVLEVFWHWVDEQRPDGSLAGVKPSLLARALRYTGDAEALWAALVGARFIDVVDNSVRVHDWSQHAQDSTHLRLARARQVFADGTVPSFKRLAKDERAEIEAHYQRMASATVSAPVPESSTACAQQAHGMRTENALPLPLPLPKPLPKPGGEAPGCDPNITPEMVTTGVLLELGMSNLYTQRALDGVCRADMKAGREPTELREALIAAWRDYDKSKPKLKFHVKPEQFFGDSVWRNREGWPWKEPAAIPIARQYAKPPEREAC